MFAKLFESEKYGQILVYKTRNDDSEPCVRYVFEYEEITVCFAPCWKDDDEGWDLQEKAFDATDLAVAERRVASAVKMFAGEET